MNTVMSTESLPNSNDSREVSGGHLGAPRRLRTLPALSGLAMLSVLLFVTVVIWDIPELASDVRGDIAFQMLLVPATEAMNESGSATDRNGMYEEARKEHVEIVDVCLMQLKAMDRVDFRGRLLGKYSGRFSLMDRLKEIRDVLKDKVVNDKEAIDWAAAQLRRLYGKLGGDISEDSMLKPPVHDVSYDKQIQTAHEKIHTEYVEALNAMTTAVVDFRSRLTQLGIPLGDEAGPSAAIELSPAEAQLLNEQVANLGKCAENVCRASRMSFFHTIVAWPGFLETQSDLPKTLLDQRQAEAVELVNHTIALLERVKNASVAKSSADKVALNEVCAEYELGKVKEYAASIDRRSRALRAMIAKDPLKAKEILETYLDAERATTHIDDGGRVRQTCKVLAVVR